MVKGLRVCDRDQGYTPGLVLAEEEKGEVLIA